MEKTGEENGAQPPDKFLSGDGEMAARIRKFDWSKTPLGPSASWSPSLKMMVRFLLANRFPMLLWWGPQFIQIYNDAYRPVLGAKHPEPGLGRPVSECWSEIWDILRPLIETPFNGGPPTWSEDIFLEINRYGFMEETHFTIAYSPVPDETVPSGIGGVLATVHEISDKVVGERRVTVLRDLGTRAVEAKTAEEACNAAAETLAKHPKDIPFALVYLIDPDGRRARLACAAGVTEGGPASPLIIELTEQTDEQQAWPLAETVRTESMQIVEDLSVRFGKVVPPGPWADPPRQAVVAPIRSNIAHHLAGLLVAGVSSRLKLDDAYRSFIELAAGQIATAIANARAYEEEKRRAEALAEIDRAKTAFFSNVSHEFRTPLTLLLGPLEDAISGALDPAQKENLEVAHRNSLRLLKLVNTLLDFSRIEAGRVQAVYEPTDLAAYTAELASMFRSAIERAGMRLVVDCPPLPEPVYVDREMWEKIVMNLLSNAFKFTFEGAITVSLRPVDDHVELRVRDTGIGIAEAEIPRLFERFHRIRGAQARTHEGTGIGLALVRELARLHGGSVSAESEVGRGTTFTVRVPAGSAHLPADRLTAERTLSSTTIGAETYIQEALRWLPSNADCGLRIADSVGQSSLQSTLNDDGAINPQSAIRNPQSKILLADDNADMRDYVQRILRSHWTVEVVSDGRAALEAALDRIPDLVLTDVMMPAMDGFELLRELRADPRTREVPVILLSARAGEESRVEGLEAGADDYLIKPFSARELVARVGTHLKMARLRDEAEAERAHLLESAQAAQAVAEQANRTKDEFLAVLSHELRTPLNAIKGWTQLLQSGDLTTEKVRQAIEVIARNVNLQNALIEDLLDVSRIVSGKMRIESEGMSLWLAVEAAVEAARPAAEKRRITIEAAFDADADKIYGDKHRLQQVVSNLLTNAIKFTPEGGAIRVALEREGNTAKLVVQDTGIGIAPDLLPHVFDPFRQADASSKRKYGGLGLGLTLVKHLVELHGGAVEVHSDGEGLGATFTVRLPLASPALLRAELDLTTGVTGKGSGTAKPLENVRLLLVDDDQDVIDLVSFVLSARGANLTCVTSAEEALRELGGQPFDLLISDLGMAEMDGYDFIREVRETISAEKLPAIALTGYVSADDRERVLECGFQTHLAKPVDVDALPLIVLSLLKNRLLPSQKIVKNTV